MRVLLISTACLEVPPSHYGGLEMIVYDLAVCLNERGYDVTVAAPHGSKFPEGITMLPTVKLPDNKWDENIALLSYIREAETMDLIHDHSHNKEIYTFLSEFENENRFCSTLHCPTSVQYPVKWPCLVTISKDHSQRIQSGYGYSSKVVHNGIDLSRFTFKEEKGDRYIFLGRPHPNKNNLGAINMCKELDVPLDMVGGMLEDSPSPYAVQVARECRLGSKWVYHGSVKHTEKAELLANAKGLIFPCSDNWHEPFGLIIPEANASGTPVIAWNRGVFKETVDHGKTGFLANTVDEFKEYMTRLDEIDPYDCRAWVKDHFTREEMTNNYEKVYDSVMKGEKW